MIRVLMKMAKPWVMLISDEKFFLEERQAKNEKMSEAVISLPFGTGIKVIDVFKMTYKKKMIVNIIFFFVYVAII